MSAESPSRPSAQNGRRSNSLVSGFIKRTKSSDLITSNSLTRNKSPENSHDAQLTTSPVQTAAPTLPTFQPQPQLPVFGGEDHATKMQSVHSQATAASASTSSLVEVAYERTQSMTNRGRYSYATSTVSSVNSPRRVRRRKDPSPYNVLIIGARNSGKTSFLNFLKSSIAPDPEQQNAQNPELDAPPPSAKVNPTHFIQHYVEIELEGERVGLSIWDSKGFDRNLVDYQLREMNNFVESKFEDTFIEEMKVIRSRGLRDTHIHCVFFLFDPAQLDMNINAAKKEPAGLGSLHKPARIVGALDEDFELQILKSLQGKTTVIPVISKADTVTAVHMAYLKRMVGESFQQAGLDPLEALHFEGYDSEDDVFDEAEEDAEIAKAQEQPAMTIGQDMEVSVESAAESQSVGATETSEKEVQDASETAAVNGDEVAGPAEPQANTKKTIIHKREGSKMSVSTVMFDNGYMPMSILSPDEHTLDGSDGPVGRKFIWGFANPYTPEHCDFVKLKETCFTEWRADFREASRVKFYERWRTGRLKRGPANGAKQETSRATASRATVGSRKPSGGIPIELDPRRAKKYTM